jgi:CBS domain-containing protein
VSAPTAEQPAVLHLSLVLRAPLVDRAGGRLGRVEDVIVRLGQEDYPPITGLLVSVAGRHSYLAAEQVDRIAHGEVRLARPKLDLQPFARRAGEVLLGKDVLDRQLINVDGARLVRANEIELARVGGWWRVVGVDTGPRGALRRLLPRRAGGRLALGTFLDWASVEPFVGHVPTVRLRVPHPKLARLHPAQIADLVEAASHREGEEILAAVRSDRELEADVFEELDDQHQGEFVEERSDGDVAETMARMAPDDAADLAAELDDDRRERVLDLLPATHRTKVRSLLGYDPARAGGLMTTDFVAMYRHATVAETLERVRRSALPSEMLTTVYLMDTHRRLDGAVALADLLRADPEDGLLEHRAPCRALRPDAGFEQIAREMADYNLTAIAIVDDDQVMLGVVTVDDVLEVMLPRGWRRRFGLFGEE